jgi:hypothetical protein
VRENAKTPQWFGFNPFSMGAEVCSWEGKNGVQSLRRGKEEANEKNSVIRIYNRGGGTNDGWLRQQQD